MLDEVSISNYKSILNQRFSLSHVNVFVGNNGSGKTNILEALGMAAAAHDEALDADKLRMRGINVENPFNRKSQSNEIEIAWKEKTSWKKAKLVCSDDVSWKDISWYEPEYVAKINNLIKFISDGSIMGEYPFEDESKNTILNAAFRASRNFRDYQIYNKFEPELFNKLLDSLAEEQLQELKSYGFDASNALFYLVLIIGKRTPLTFAIDNIEINDLIPTITKLAVQHNKQAFITTSDTAIVNFVNFKDPDIKLFSVKMSEDEQTLIEEMRKQA